LQWGECKIIALEYLDESGFKVAAKINPPILTPYLLYDVEQEVNNLYTYARKPGLNPVIICAINSQKAAIEQ